MHDDRRDDKKQLLNVRNQSDATLDTIAGRKELFAGRKILWPKDTSWPFWFATTSMFMNVFSQCEYLKAIIMYALNSHPKLEALARASQPAKLVSSS